MPYSLIMLDLDQFKEVNDQRGHLLGDGVLREVSELIVSTVRQDDLCFRYGGDEIAILLPDTDADGLPTAAEKVRELMSREEELLGGLKATTTTADA